MQIYAKNATPAELLTNGIGAIEPSSAIVHEEINGEFSITLEIPLASRNFDAITGGAIVQAMTPRGNQYFRLTQPRMTLTGKTAFGWHISYDLAQDMILDTNVVAKTGAEAMAIILAAGISETRFTGTSDISTINNARLVRMSPLAALIGDTDNAFKTRWGGEIERNNFTVNMKSQLGADNGVTVMYRKNLTGLDIVESWDDVANRIVPSGLTTTDAALLLPEVYIDSTNIGLTPVPHVRHVHYSDVKVGAEDEDGNVPYPTASAVYTELRARVAALYAAGADLPLVTASVQFQDLSKTEEYKNYAVLETVNLGDTVRCKHQDLSVNLTQRVMAYDFDALLGDYVSVTLGTLAPTIADSAYAQDIDLQALKNGMETVVKQGSRYNEVYINHADGFVAIAEIDGQIVKAKLNGSAIGFYNSSDQMIGGFAVVNGEIVNVAGMLTTKLTDNCYAKIGEVSTPGGIMQGIALYRKDISTTVPYARIALDPSGYLWVATEEGQYFQVNGIERFWMLPNGNMLVKDGSNQIRVAMEPDGSNQMLFVDENNLSRHGYIGNDSFLAAGGGGAWHAVGADASGPYYIKNGSKTYF